MILFFFLFFVSFCSAAPQFSGSFEIVNRDSNVTDKLGDITGYQVMQIPSDDPRLQLYPQPMPNQPASGYPFDDETQSSSYLVFQSVKAPANDPLIVLAALRRKFRGEKFAVEKIDDMMRYFYIFAHPSAKACKPQYDGGSSKKDRDVRKFLRAFALSTSDRRVLASLLELARVHYRLDPANESNKAIMRALNRRYEDTAQQQLASERMRMSALKIGPFIFGVTK